MTMKTELERLADHYDYADTSDELGSATPASPEAPPGAERMTTFAVRLPVGLLAHVREIADQQKTTTSAMIRRWIEAGIAEDGTNAGERVISVQALLELIGRAPREAADR